MTKSRRKAITISSIIAFMLINTLTFVLIFALTNQNFGSDMNIYYNVPTNHVNYQLNGDGTGYIVTGVGTDFVNGKLVIPANYNNLPIKEINSGAFQGVAAIEDVKIPNTITELTYSVFADCTGLTSITIPANITKICGNTFNNCLNLLSINFADTDGWILASSLTATEGEDMSSLFQNPETAATYFTGAYQDQYFIKI